MLRKIFILAASTACFAALAMVPLQASAHTRSTVHHCPTSNGSHDCNCAPGNNDGNYCERHCRVPNLHDASLDRARWLLREAGCRLGEVHTIGHGPRPLIIVERQNPAAGSVLPFGSPVAVWVLRPKSG